MSDTSISLNPAAAVFNLGFYSRHFDSHILIGSVSALAAEIRPNSLAVFQHVCRESVTSPNLMADDDGVVQLCHLDGPAATIFLRGHTDTVDHLAFSADGRQIATLSHDQTLRLWDAANEAEQACFDARCQELFYFTYVEAIEAWQILDRQSELRTFNTHVGVAMDVPLLRRHSVSAVAGSADGSTLLIGRSDGSVELWDTNVLIPDAFVAPDLLLHRLLEQWEASGHVPNLNDTTEKIARTYGGVIAGQFRDAAEKLLRMDRRLRSIGD